MLHPLRWLSDQFEASYRMWGQHDSLRATALEGLSGHLAAGEPKGVCLRCRPAQCCRTLEVSLTWEEEVCGGYVLDPCRRQHGHAVLLRRPEGACVYLEDELCSIYERRPQACRGYFCGDDGRLSVAWPAH